MKYQPNLDHRTIPDVGVKGTGFLGQGTPLLARNLPAIEDPGRKGVRSASPTVLLRIRDDAIEMRRSFSDFAQAVLAAEAYAAAGFTVGMISATGHFLMDFQPRWPKLAV